MIKGLTYGELRQMVREALKEDNVTASVSSYQTPSFNKKTSEPFMKKVQRPKRPSHTKLFDYL